MSYADPLAQKAQKYYIDHKIDILNHIMRRQQFHRALMDGELAKGCLDCGEKDLTVLEFDHVRGVKIKEVSKLFNSTPEMIYAEIDKCDVVCANCHKRRTMLRRGGSRRYVLGV